ncbi:MAG TPA: parallel beta-helix domain-containing protein [Myxococcaceae bacterium]|nr:parallel beta-helix domain-containing protein [Myxococcaceae bacterium]
MNRFIRLLGAAGAAALLATACGSSSGSSNNTVSIDPTMSEAAIASAFSGAAENTVLSMAAGTYHFTNSLNLSTKNNITVKGAGMTSTILDFSAQAGGADGVVQSVPSGSTIKTTFQDFSIRDTAGDGLKVTGGNGLHVNNVGVAWPTRTQHGAYGIYPVQCKNVLVENSSADGASDTGIYVGQSDTIVVRNNTVTHNVSGIEIENSFNADVTNNNSHDNTVGFLVFDLPDLPQVGGHNVRVYSNQFTNNNTPNFGDPAGTVALVPAGTGGAVMANSKVEIFGNTFSGNTAAGFAVISCFTAFGQQTCLNGTTGYLPIPSQIAVHDNTFTNNGTDPLSANTDQTHPSFQLAALLASGFSPAQGQPGWLDNHVSDVLYDGVLGLGTPPNPYMICSHNNGSGHFADMHLDHFDAQNPNLNSILTFDEAAFDCTLPALPAVPVPAL